MKKQIKIIKKANCPKLSKVAKGDLTYHVGYDNSKALHLRVTANTGGGFFSNEWIALEAITQIIKSLPFDSPFKATILKPLYQSQGANNHGFLAAALRAEEILLPVAKHPLSHTLSDTKSFTKAMQTLIKEKIDLEDDVAASQRIKDAKRAEMIAKMKSPYESL
ncbi:hypothetical protein [Dasania marina]|uniref:hypothetical protein n=1 Tax=Dasania marina TaxID=471499 RepID=UPI0030DBFD54